MALPNEYLQTEMMMRLCKSILAWVMSSVLVATAATAQTPAVGPKKEEAARAEALRLVDVWLDSVQAYQRLPALSAAIVQDDKIVWSKGYGKLDVAHKIPATAQTLYSICSISKLFTSVALMQLWEAGQVRLDEPFVTYLPWATLRPLERDSVPITLRAMLSHSAGLPRESDFPYWTAPDYPFPTRDEIKARITEQTPLWPASRWYQYSNLGLTLVGETISAVSGESYADYVQHHVLDPLHLKDTHPFMPMSLYGKRLAVGWSAETREGTRELVRPFDARGVAPAAGYVSTVEDLGRFAAWQFRLLRTEAPEVLRASTLREMQRVQFADPAWKVTRGLGFGVSRRGEQTYVGHGGDCPGYHSVLSLRPATGTAVTAILTGAEHPAPLAASVFELLDKRKNWSFKDPLPADVDLEAYVGRYSSQPFNAETAIMPWAGGLAVLSLPTVDPAGDLLVLKPKGDDVFRVLRLDGSEADEVRFERDKSGRVIRFVQFSNFSKRLGPLAQ
jgi:CubicO group peptidase (beta-lactamase class C family)